MSSRFVDGRKPQSYTGGIESHQFDPAGLQTMNDSSQIKIQVNGESRHCPATFTVAELLNSLEMKPKFVAVEQNEQLVPRAQHADCHLSEGDRIEIVTLVGGG